MSPRGFISFAIVTGIALIAAIALVVAQQIAASGDRRGDGPMFAALAERAADVQTLTIEGPNYTIALQRQADGQWVATDLGNYPVNGDPVNQFVAGLSELVEYERKTDTEELFVDLGVLGAGEGRPDIHVTVAADDGDVLVDAILGYAAQSIGRHTRGGMFVRRTNEDYVWLAEGAARPPTFISEFFGMLFTIPGPTVGRVSIFSGETMLLDAVKVNFQTGDYELAYLDPSVGPEGATAADNAIRGFSSAIVSTTFVSVLPREDVTVADDARVLRFITEGGLSLSITMAEADGKTYVIYEADAEPGSEAEAQAAEIAAVTDGFAFELQPGRIFNLTRDITEFFDPPEPTAPETPAPATPAPLIPVPVPGP